MGGLRELANTSMSLCDNKGIGVDTKFPRICLPVVENWSRKAVLARSGVAKHLS